MTPGGRTYLFSTLEAQLESARVMHVGNLFAWRHITTPGRVREGISEGR